MHIAKGSMKINRRVKPAKVPTKKYSAKELFAGVKYSTLKKKNSLIGPKAAHHKHEPTGQ